MPKIVDQDARREEVLSPTWRAILKGGLGGATMRAIAAEAGTSTGTVNHYFADKEAILLAALRLNQQRTIARLKATVETSEPGLAALRVLVEAALPLDEDRRASWIVWQTFWAAFPDEEAFEAEQRSGYLSWRELFRDQLRSAVARSECRADLDVAYEADRLIAFVVGLGMQDAVLRVRRNNARTFRFIDEHLAMLGAS